MKEDLKILVCKLPKTLQKKYLSKHQKRKPTMVWKKALLFARAINDHTLHLGCA